MFQLHPLGFKVCSDIGTLGTASFLEKVLSWLLTIKGSTANGTVGTPFYNSPLGIILYLTLSCIRVLRVYREVGRSCSNCSSAPVLLDSQQKAGYKS